VISLDAMPMRLPVAKLGDAHPATTALASTAIKSREEMLFRIAEEASRMRH
jgi:hypothetical protein